jgi:hypothetical protein
MRWSQCPFDYYIMETRLHELAGFPDIQWIAPVDPQYWAWMFILYR